MTNDIDHKNDSPIGLEEKSPEVTATPEKPPPNASYDKASWIGVNVLIPLEDNYRTTLTERQVRQFCRDLHDWSENDLLRTVEFIKRECQARFYGFFPTLSDFYRLRPRKQEPDLSAEPLPLPQEMGKSVANLSPGSWDHFVAMATLEALRDRKLTMVDAYDKIIAEGERRQISDGGLRLDLDGFRLAREKTIEMRDAMRNQERNHHGVMRTAFEDLRDGKTKVRIQKVLA